jgi:hypothetical protein
MLSDAQVTITKMGPDDGAAGTSVGSATTLCIDSVEVSQTREIVDAGCMQDAVATNRVARLNWEIKIDTKFLIDPTFFIDLQSSNAVLVTVAITTADLSITGTGIISAINVKVGNPSTLALTIVPYGSVLTIVAV